MDKLISITVVSDIHAFSTRQNAAGSVQDYSSANSVSPLEDLIRQAPELGITSDILVCAGDISNRADAVGLEKAWHRLHDLKTALGASQFVCTNGNHDLDSRYLDSEKDPDPKGFLLSLVPSFPFNDANLDNHYWARNFAVLDHPSGIVMVVLNTSSYHGGKQDEIEHGRVSLRTIAAIRKALESRKSASAHVLICHHHPLPLDGYAGSTDLEYLRHGQDLLNALVETTGTSWLVIHGHRHHPHLIHGASRNNDLSFVLGAGSLGARMQSVPNQFHKITLYTSNSSDHDYICGTVDSWNWSDATSWIRSNGSPGLPPLCGFGYRGQVRKLAQTVAQEVGLFLEWNKLAQKIPAVNHLVPQSLRDLEHELKSHNLNVLRDENGMIAQIGRGATGG